MTNVKFGPLNFANALGYLFWINKEFRDILPGKPDNEDILTSTMASARNKIWKRLEGFEFKMLSFYRLILMISSYFSKWRVG